MLSLVVTIAILTIFGGVAVSADASVIESVMDRVFSENAQAIADYKNGKVKAKQALFGACMRELKNTADTAVIKDILEKKLSEI